MARDLTIRLNKVAFAFCQVLFVLVAAVLVFAPLVNTTLIMRDLGWPKFYWRHISLTLGPSNIWQLSWSVAEAELRGPPKPARLVGPISELNSAMESFLTWENSVRLVRKSITRKNWLWVYQSSPWIDDSNKDYSFTNERIRTVFVEWYVLSYPCAVVCISFIVRWILKKPDRVSKVASG